MEGPARFTEIRGSVDGLSARLLAERLRELEAAGLMERRELPGGAVEYRLTAKGAGPLAGRARDRGVGRGVGRRPRDGPEREEAPHAPA